LARDRRIIPRREISEGARQPARLRQSSPPASAGQYCSRDRAQVLGRNDELHDHGHGVALPTSRPTVKVSRVQGPKSRNEGDLPGRTCPGSVWDRRFRSSVCSLGVDGCTRQGGKPREFRVMGRSVIGTRLIRWCRWQVPARGVTAAGRGACRMRPRAATTSRSRGVHFAGERGYHSEQSAPAKGLQLDYRRTGAVVGSWVVGSGSRVTIVMLGTMTVLFFVASAKFPQLDADSRRAMLTPVRT
jgi:hypothetical protein